MAVTVFRNGRFFTGPADASNDSPPAFPECMIVQDDLITYIGSGDNADVTHAIQSGGHEYDMDGRTVLPGFIDGHMHLMLLGQSLNKIDLTPCKNLADIRAKIATFALSNPSAPRVGCKCWITSTIDGEATAAMLEGIDGVNGRAIFIDAKDLHSLWCNETALQELGVQDLPDPAGGKIHRTATGKASGLLSEAAAITYGWPHFAKVGPMEEKVDSLRAAFSAYTAAGYTGAIDMAMDENAWAALQVLRSRERIPVRLAAHWIIHPSADESAMLAQVDRAIVLHKQFNIETSPDCRIAGIKIVCDGVVDSCTAALAEPYSSNGLFCSPLWTPSMLAPVVRKADVAGLQCALHAIGDQAVSNAVATLRDNCVRGHRHRIEHLELCSREDAIALGELGITASIQPVHADPIILPAWPKLLGDHRCGRAFAYKEMRDGGATLAIGTDTPTAPYVPFPNLYTATTRRSAREPETIQTVNEHFALPLASAIAAATEGAAYSCFAEQWTGKLAAGLKADFTVVDMTWSPQDLLQAKIREVPLLFMWY
ncbi:hypothetical protein H2203_008834 [Taxawa tesnikishii (nom. ined.)]|nr:hypothetical protein H2203_008834 [Dothideales sp. JES 119]